MKNLIVLSFLLSTQTLFASYGKPELLARFSDVEAWNAPDNTWCFSGEPSAFKGKVYLQCFDFVGTAMMEFQKGSYQHFVRAQEGNIFSHPLIINGMPTWYESNEFSVVEAYKGKNPLGIKGLQPGSFGTDSFTGFGSQWLYRYKGDVPELWTWDNHEMKPFFTEKVSFIFTPYGNSKGEVGIKTREVNYSESSPDKIWHYDGTNWKVALEDKDSNPSSPWKSFRNQLALGDGFIVTIARDEKSDVLIKIQGGKAEVIARAGVDLKSLDFFSPKVHGNTIVFRGDDLEGRKAVYYYDGTKIQKLLTQGDLVMTDKGDGRVHYQNQDAILYGSPGFDEKGNIYLQATLVDDSNPNTLLGIGLLKFERE